MIHSNSKYFAVIGNPISQSLSPVLFSKYTSNYQNEYYYSRILATDIKEVKELVEVFNIKGLNVTSPFKNDVISLSTFQTDEVTELQVANTIIFNDNETLGFNTDITGVKIPLKKIIKKSYESALILGAGGASKAALYALKSLNIENIFITNRTAKKSKKIAKTNQINFIDFSKLDIVKYDIIINTIPIKIKEFAKFHFKKSAVVFDANYKISPLYEISKLQKVKYIGGLEWLIEQGKKSYELMTGIKQSDIRIDSSDIKKIKNKAKRISLIGPMGSWKSSVGKLMSEKLGFEFVDIDSLIEEYEKQSIKNIFAMKGEKYFRSLEHKMLKKVLKKKNIVISTGGGIITNKKNIKLLKTYSWNILLYSSPQESFSRININKRPMLRGKNVLKILQHLFKERKKSYYQTSDLIINTNRSSSKKISNILYEDYYKAFQI